VAEVGAALNGNRPKLRRLLADPAVATVGVEHRDRLARFGVDYVEAALAAHGRTLVATPTTRAVTDRPLDLPNRPLQQAAKRHAPNPSAPPGAPNHPTATSRPSPHLSPGSTPRPNPPLSTGANNRG